MKVLVPLAEGFEELEAVTICDILVRGGIEVVTASLEEEQLVQASRGTQIFASTTLQAVKGIEFDLIVLPGGLPGSDYLMQNETLIGLLQQQAKQDKLVGAICAAPKVLVSAGILDNKRATSFPNVIEQNPALGMTFQNQPVVVDGNVVTSRSAGTALDFALTLVELLTDKANRDQVEIALHR